MTHFGSANFALLQSNAISITISAKSLLDLRQASLKFIQKDRGHRIVKLILTEDGKGGGITLCEDLSLTV